MNTTRWFPRAQLEGGLSCNVYLDFKNISLGALVRTPIGLYTSLLYSFVEIPRTRHVAKKEIRGAVRTRSGPHHTGVEAKTGLCLISRPPSAGVRPDPTWSCIRNQLDLLYLQAEPFRGADCDQTGMSVKALNSGDLAAQDQTARVRLYVQVFPECTSGPFYSEHSDHISYRK